MRLSVEQLPWAGCAGTSGISNDGAISMSKEISLPKEQVELDLSAETISPLDKAQALDAKAGKAIVSHERNFSDFKKWIVFLILATMGLACPCNAANEPSAPDIFLERPNSSVRQQWVEIWTRFDAAVREKRLGDAESIIKKVKEDDGDDRLVTFMHAYLANEYLNNLDYLNTEAHLEKAQKSLLLPKNYYQVTCRLALIRYQTQEALDQCTRNVQSNYNPSSAFLFRSVAYMWVNDLKNAEEDIESSKKEPNVVSEFYEGVYYLIIQKNNLALISFSKFLNTSANKMSFQDLFVTATLNNIICRKENKTCLPYPGEYLGSFFDKYKIRAAVEGLFSAGTDLDKIIDLETAKPVSSIRNSTAVCTFLGMAILHRFFLGENFLNKRQTKDNYLSKCKSSEKSGDYITMLMIERLL